MWDSNSAPSYACRNWVIFQPARSISHVECDEKAKQNIRLTRICGVYSRSWGSPKKNLCRLWLEEMQPVRLSWTFLNNAGEGHVCAFCLCILLAWDVLTSDSREVNIEEKMINVFDLRMLWSKTFTCRNARSWATYECALWWVDCDRVRQDIWCPWLSSCCPLCGPESWPKAVEGSVSLRHRLSVFLAALLELRADLDLT